MTALLLLPLSYPLSFAAAVLFQIAPAIGACGVGGWICARMMAR
jgi:hypothetical protein